jgi:cytochrome c-type biogenesis protein CcmH/NrfF
VELDLLWMLPLYFLIAVAAILYVRHLRKRPYQPTPLQRFAKRFTKPS